MTNQRLGLCAHVRLPFISAYDTQLKNKKKANVAKLLYHCLTIFYRVSLVIFVVTHHTRAIYDFGLGKLCTLLGSFRGCGFFYIDVQ